MAEPFIVSFIVCLGEFDMSRSGPFITAIINIQRNFTFERYARPQLTLCYIIEREFVKVNATLETPRICSLKIL